MLPFKSLTSSKQLTPEIIEQVFNVIDKMALNIETKGRIDLLDDKVVALLFFEPSSRTMMSFQSAAQRLKAGMVFAQNASSTSFEKGESLEDLIRMVEAYSDNEHPTQSLIDAYTIHKEKGRLDSLNIVFGFDSLQSRSIHSLSRLLSQYKNNQFTFVGPKELEPSKELLSELSATGTECKSAKSRVKSVCTMVMTWRT